MIAGVYCDCLVCQMEKSLNAELANECVWKSHILAANSSNALRAFRSALDVVAALHAPSGSADTLDSDRLLVEILAENVRAERGSLWQQLLLLVFVPTIHATASHITGRFTPLARDDVSQHVVSVFLELLVSNEFRVARSHVAFAVSRKLRRHAFRWAVHEARLAVPREMGETPIEEIDDRALLDAEVVLQDFLDNCQTAGWLLDEERNLLIQLKVKRISCRELASRNGHSAVAIQHKIQRVLDKLRRVAAKGPPRQLELFSPGTKKKVFL